MNVDNIKVILDRMQFYGGRRDMRELWDDKPTDAQDAEIDTYNADIKAIRDYIQQFEAQLPKWVSVEERLPEGKGSYLACYEVTGIRHKILQVLPYECGFGFWKMTPPSEGFDQVVVEGVTHWMPLPEPPEEVQHE